MKRRPLNGWYGWMISKVLSAPSVCAVVDSSGQRKDRTLAQVAQRRVHSAGNAAVPGRCAAAGGGLRRSLQQRSPEQRGWLHHAKGHARRAPAGDPRRAGSEAGGGAKTAADSSAAVCVIRFGANVREAHVSGVRHTSCSTRESACRGDLSSSAGIRAVCSTHSRN